MSDLLSRVRDVNTAESRVVQSVATGAFTAFVSPRKLSSRSLFTMHALSGLVGAAGGALVVGEKASTPARATAAVAVGATLFGASALGTVADTKAEEWLVRRGVRRPRLWMGLVAALVTWLTSGPKPADEAEPADEPETVNVDQPEGANPSR